jgi:hypothetical protein
MPNHGLAKAGAFGIYSTSGIFLKSGMNCKSEFLLPAFAKPQTVRHNFRKIKNGRQEFLQKLQRTTQS